MIEQKTQSDEIFVVNTQAVPTEDLTKKGAANVKVRYLVDERHGSERFALREYSVDKGGQTPLDQHEYEHQVYVMRGEGILRMGSEKIPAIRTIRPGDVIFIPSNSVHQFINEREEPLVFLCLKGNPSLYSSLKEGADPPSEDAC